MKITLLTLSLCLLSQIGMAQIVSLIPDQVQAQANKERVENPKRKNQLERIAQREALAQPEAKAYVRLLSVESLNSEMATIILKLASDVTVFEGCQMWLDSKAQTYGSIIPATGTKLTSGDPSESLFGQFDYKIPSNATRTLTETVCTTPGKADTITVPPGTYDYCILYPNTRRFQEGFWFVNATSEWCRKDDIKFEKGYSYTFYIQADRGIDYYPPSNLAATKLILPPDGRLTDAEVIKLNVKNLGVLPASNYKVGYRINGGKSVTEMVSATLNEGEDYLHTFSAKADMSQSGLYKVDAWVEWTDDMNNSDDKIFSDTKYPAVSELPFSENFEQAENLRANWTIIDANNDGYTWKWSYSSSVETESGCISYSANREQDADDYLISDPITFTKGDIHILFDYNTSYDQAAEMLDVLYGKSSDPQSMTLISHMENLNNDHWKKGFVNFQVQEAGEYYVAFHIRSPQSDNNICFDLDAISINSGRYTGTPDLELRRMQVPLSACDIEDIYSMSVTVGNNGNEEINAFTLYLQIDDQPAITQECNVRIEPGGEKIVDFYAQGGTFAFPEFKKYTVKCWAECERDAEPENNELVSAFRHYDPINTLPYTSYFYDEEVASDWYTPDPEGGYFDYDWETCEILTDSIPYVSRCFYLEPGDYRVRLLYKAGLTVMGYECKENFVMMYGPSGTDPMKWEQFMDVKDEINSSYVNKEARFKITEAGSYSLAVMTTQWDKWQGMGLLSIKEVSLDKINEHDLQLKQFSSTLTSQIPEKQLNGVHSFQVLASNRGSQVEKNIKVEFSSEGNLLATSQTINQLGYNALGLMKAKGSVPAWKKGETVNLKAVALADNNVRSEEYNYSFAVSDTVFALDKCTEHAEQGVGANSPISFGNVFTLAVKDTLTSISVGFVKTDKELPLDIKVYRMGQNSKIASTILMQSGVRPMDSGFKTYSLPIRVMEPGDYYFEISQKNNQNLGISGDKQVDGFFYATLNDSLVAISEYGNLAIRPNFGHSAKVFDYDLGVESIKRPIKEGVFKTNEPIRANIVNSGLKDATNISVHCSVDGNELPVQTISKMGVYEQKQITFTGDLSKPGTHLVKVWTVFANDANPANNSLEITVLCKEPSTIYEIDFEECEDFAVKDFVPAWTTVDVDEAPTAGIQGYTFPRQFTPMGFVIFNPFETTPSMEFRETILPHSGLRFGASFTIGSASRNDWLISPKLKLGSGSSMEFYVKSYMGSYGAESYLVLVSETGNLVTDFVNISGTLTAPAEEWEKVEIDLGEYDNKSVYVAILCNAANGFIFMVDDIRVLTTTSSIEDVSGQQNMKIYPNPVRKGELIHVESAGNQIKSISVYDAYGTPVSVDGLSLASEFCQVPTSGLSDGVYFIRVSTESGVKTLKCMVIK